MGLPSYCAIGSSIFEAMGLAAGQQHVGRNVVILPEVRFSGRASHLDYARYLTVGVKLLSEISRYLIADFCMTTGAIIEHLDIFKDRPPRLFTGGETVVMQALRLQSQPSSVGM